VTIEVSVVLIVLGFILLVWFMGRAAGG